PFLVQIFFIFFALPQIGIKLNPTVTAIIALALNGGAYAIEIIRGGVDSIPKGQVEAGLALGLHRAQIFRHIILKPALRAV
ncbi:ABC transporter permease subunit, partial [Staphylococcus aureus]